MKLRQFAEGDTFELEKLNNDVLNINAKIDNIIDLSIDGTMPKDRVKLKLAELESQKQLVVDTITHLTKSNEEIQSEIKEIEDIIQKIKSQEIKKEYTRQELIKAISKITINSVDNEYDINISYKITDKLMKYVGSKYKNYVENTLKSKWVSRFTKEVQLYG